MPKNDKDYGGPAFPTDAYYDEKIVGAEPGMTLRDYFAAKVMQALVAHATNDEAMAKTAYRVADLMIAERRK